jgi:hypothetical protein
MEQDSDGHLSASSQEVPFEMTLCA